MYKFLTPATAIALALGLQGCGTMPTFPKLHVTGTGTPSTASEQRGHMEEQMAVAEAAQSAGDSASAVRILRDLAREFPLALQPRIKLGDALLAANAPQEAARAYQGANAIKKTLGGLVGLGRVELALRKPAEALQAFESAAKIKADDDRVMNGRAVALDQLGRHEEAQKLYLSLLEREPSNLKVRNNYALSLGLAGKYDDAADILNSLVQVPDSEARIRQNLALVYGLAGNDGQAAHVGRMDLDEDAVKSNLRYYRTIRNLDSPAAMAAELTHPTAHGPVGPEVSHYDAADSAPAAKVVRAKPAPATYLDAPRAEASPDKSDNAAALESRNVEPTKVRPASNPRKAHRSSSLSSLPMTRAEAAAQEASSGDDAKSASGEQLFSSSFTLGSDASAESSPNRTEVVAAAPTARSVQPVGQTAAAPSKARQPAVPPAAKTPSRADVTAAIKPVEAQADVTPKAAPVREASAVAKASKTSGKAHAPKGDVLEANPLDTGVRAPAVPAIL